MRLPSVAMTGRTATALRRRSCSRRRWGLGSIFATIFMSNLVEYRGRRKPHQNRSAAGDVLADRDGRLEAAIGRNDQLGPGAELDQAEQFAAAELLARRQAANDPARDQAGNLADDDRAGNRGVGREHDGVGLVALAALGMAGVEELAGLVLGSDNAGVAR